MRVKICGLTSIENVRAVVDAAPDAIGLVLAASPRQVSMALAARLLAEIPSGIEKVAVFREPAPGVLAEVIRLPFDTVQAWSSWDARALPETMAFLPAFSDRLDLQRCVEAYVRCRPISGLGQILVDGAGGGGLGERVVVDRARDVSSQWPTVLAGGLSPENVAGAIRRIHPNAVDVSSGVESSPGVKDLARVHAFIGAARGI